MKPSEAHAEILKLIEEGRALGASAPSPELIQFLNDLALSGGLKAPLKKKSGTSPRKRVAKPRRTEAEMSKTIEDLAAKLRAAFKSADAFDALITEPETQQLTKPNVVKLFNRVFDAPEPLPKSATKAELFAAMKRERINWVRSH